MAYCSFSITKCASIVSGDSLASDQKGRPQCLSISLTEPIYKKDGDLEFVNTILKNQENKIDKTIKVLKNIIKKNDHYQNNNMDFIKTIQALDFLDKYKKNNNSYRYNLHKKISDRYNYNLF